MEVLVALTIIILLLARSYINVYLYRQDKKSLLNNISQFVILFSTLFFLVSIIGLVVLREPFQVYHAYLYNKIYYIPISIFGLDLLFNLIQMARVSVYKFTAKIRFLRAVSLLTVGVIWSVGVIAAFSPK